MFATTSHYSTWHDRAGTPIIVVIEEDDGQRCCGDSIMCEYDLPVGSSWAVNETEELARNHDLQTTTDMVVATLPRVFEDHHDAAPLQGPSDPFACFSYLHLEDDDNDDEGGGDEDSSSPLSEPDPVWIPEHDLAASEVSEDSMSSSPLWSSDPIWHPELEVAGSSSSGEDSMSSSPLWASDPIGWHPELDLAAASGVSEDNRESSPPLGPSDATIGHPCLDLSATHNTPKDSDPSSSAPQGPSGPIWRHHEVLHVLASQDSEGSADSEDSEDSEESLEPSPQGPWEPLWFPLPDLLEEESDWEDVCHLGGSPEFQLGYSGEEEEVEADEYDVDATPWGEWDRKRSWGDDGAWAGKEVGGCGWAERMNRLSEWMSC